MTQFTVGRFGGDVVPPRKSLFAALGKAPNYTSFYGVSTATVGPISAAPASCEPLPAAVDRLPFHSRRGTLARRIGNRLAGAYHTFSISADRYTQLEIWATA